MYCENPDEIRISSHLRALGTEKMRILQQLQDYSEIPVTHECATMLNYSK